MAYLVTITATGGDAVAALVDAVSQDGATRAIPQAVDGTQGVLSMIGDQHLPKGGWYEAVGVRHHACLSHDVQLGVAACADGTPAHEEVA